VRRVMQRIDPSKDVDGFHPLNVGRLLAGDEEAFVPCTPLGILKMLERSGVPVESRHVVIVGRSNTVGKPLAALLMQKRPGCNATVTVAHSQTHDLTSHCRRADILVAAIGKPEFIRGHMVAEGAIVIDVGVNRVEDKSVARGYRLVGDVAFDEVKERAASVTPVPGGVGPMTVAMVLYNTWTSYVRRQTAVLGSA
jgi:methylenetetrahydrofolate dehydrogenase (NADP+) / methenyltetrahydrofolate cyclohydrolase